jgi:hypothetical protein
MPGPSPRVYYRLSGPVQAVKLEAHPGSSLRNPTQDLVVIPAEATIELETTTASKSGLVDVLWNGHPYSVFFGDLQEKAHIVAAGK